MKTHWLYGFGPNKEVKFNIEIDEETNCDRCIHFEVCDHNMEKRCFNFTWGTSQYDGCMSCTLRFTRWDSYHDGKDKIPCFHCKFFKEIV